MMLDIMIGDQFADDGTFIIVVLGLWLSFEWIAYCNQLIKIELISSRINNVVYFMCISISMFYVLRVLISGFQAATGQHQTTATSLAGGTLNATALFNGSGVGTPVASVTPTAAAYASSHHALGGGQFTLPTAAAGPQPHSVNPAIEATLSQAYSGIAQYTGIRLDPASRFYLNIVFVR